MQTPLPGLQKIRPLCAIIFRGPSTHTRRWPFYLLLALSIGLVPALLSTASFAQTLTWQKQYNGPNSLDDSAVKVKSDTAGNVYVTGTSEGDIITIKYNAAGVQQWVARYDSLFTNDESANLRTRDQATDLLVDAAGNAYVTGTSFYNGNCDKVSVITLKYNSSGVQQWKVENTATAFCGEASQMAAPHLATDGAGNLYLAVSYNAGSNPDNQIVLQKLTPAGHEVWKSSYPGTNTNVVSAFGLDVDAAGNTYVAGSDTTALLLKYNPAGSLQWQKRPEGLYGISVKSDASGNAYVIGSNGDIITIKYNGAGVQQWRVSYNGGQYLDDGIGYRDTDDGASNLLVDAAGNAYVTGTSHSGGNCVGIRAIALKYNSQGVPQWTGGIAGAFCGGDMGEPQLAMDGAKNLYFAVTSQGESSELEPHLTIKKLTSAGNEVWQSSYVQKGLSVGANALHVDASGNAYVTGSIINYNDDYTDYEFDILTLKYAASAAPACKATGSILREYWANVPGRTISDIPLNTPVTSQSQLTLLRTAANAGDNYAQRLRGYICAPATGDYSFFIQGDDQAELYLSNDDDPANKQLLASARLAWSWTDNASQQSAPISLVAGKSYYLEVRHKEGSGGDQVRVGWRTPGMAANAQPVIIPGAVLSPFYYFVQAPTSLSITNVAATRIYLSWHDDSNNETSYVVERATTGAGPYAKVATLAANTVSYDDGGLSPVTTYFYRVYAVAEPGASAYSYGVSGTTSTSTVLREYWANVPGGNISDIPLNSPVTSRSQLTSLRTAANAGDNYAQRIRGYVLAPTSGTYTFFIQGDDKAELYLSTDKDPANKQLIASARLAWSWTDNASQQSAPVSLVGGQNYYLEVLHKESSGGDQVRVGWRTPGMPASAEPVIIPGAVLSPFDDLPATPTNLTIRDIAISSLVLEWEASIEHVDHFVLERATSASGPFSIANPYVFSEYANALADINVQPNTTYFYRIYAVNQYGVSGYSNVASATTLEGCTATGTILREYWSNIPGNDISDIQTSRPATISQLTSLTIPTNQGDNYGEHIRGYLCAPETGNYTFWIASNNEGGLSLSTDRNPQNENTFAFAPGGTLPKQWDKYPSQQSWPTYLVKGRSYYIEVRHKAGIGNDDLAVGWNTPSNTGAPVIIPGAVLSPFVLAASTRESISELAAVEVLTNELTASPNPFSERVTICFTTVATELARLQVYDLQGRLVGQLYEGLSQAGEVHQFRFDGNRLNQGLYLVRLATARQVSHQKLLLTK